MVFYSGSAAFDELLNGGYCRGVINTIYGPAATGKTTACMLAAIECAKSGKKTVFIDTEGGFSIERLSQLTPDYKKIVENILLLRISSFEEQARNFRLLSELTNNLKIGLVVVDTIGANYRAEKGGDYHLLNSELCSQIDILKQIAKRDNLLTLMTNQVYSSIEKKDVIVPVGGEIIRNRCACMIELKALAENKRMACLVCHPEIKEKREICFEIVKEGFNKV